jgi:predicted DCC family thiol-disulfide oxidoreductase YuxK
MQKLQRFDTLNQIKLVNLHQLDFPALFPEINVDKAMTILHGYYQNKLLLGLDVTHRAWTIVGKGLYVAPLQFPVIKPLAHMIYLLMAKFRHPISQFIYQHLGIGLNNCELGTCNEKNKNTDHRRK